MRVESTRTDKVKRTQILLTNLLNKIKNWLIINEIDVREFDSFFTINLKEEKHIRSGFIVFHHKRVVLTL